MVIGFLFQKTITGEYTFSGADSLSPSAVHEGMASAEKEYGKYPLWIPWIFSGLPSVHSFQNISEFYFPNLIVKILKTIGIPSFWNYVFHFIIAGMGIIAILRKLGVSLYSSLFGGICLQPWTTEVHKYQWHSFFRD